jgi:cytochrome c oxidase subunit IV
MSANTAHEHADHGNALYMKILFALVAMTLLEVFLAYERMAVVPMLIILMGLSVLKAALIIAYFMHLKFERFSLFLTLIPMCVLCICLFAVFFPDAQRLIDFRFPK